MKFGFIAYANGHHSGMRTFDPSSDSYTQQYTQVVAAQSAGIEDIPQMLLDQGLIGAALLLCGVIIWKLAKKMEVMNDKILDLVQHDSELKAKLVTHMEGVERELERIRRNGHG